MINWVESNTDLIIALTALAAVITSITSIWLSIRALHMQRMHNFQSVRPIAHISIGDYENCLFIKLMNNGVGPLIITKFTAAIDGTIKNSIVELMPNIEPFHWDSFTGNINNRSVSQDDDLTILQISGDVSDNEFINARDSVRRVLEKITVRVEYRDIYDREQCGSERSLDWFGRNVRDSV